MKYLKITALIVCVFFTVISLTSCYLLRTAFGYNYDEQIQSISGKVAHAVAKKDAQELYAMFSEEVRQSVPELEEQLENMLALFNGKIKCTDYGKGMSLSVEYDAGERRANSGGWAEFSTKDSEYRLSFNAQLCDTDHPQRVGIQYIKVYHMEDKEWVKHVYPFRGVHVFTVEECWYDASNITEGTLSVNNEPVEPEYPVLFSDLALIPLFSVIDAIGGHYEWNKDAETIDMWYEDQHFQFTFPEPLSENFRLIALRDMNLERDLRLSNTESALGTYTIINDTVYLSEKTGSYLCSWFDVLITIGHESHRIDLDTVIKISEKKQQMLDKME